MRGWALSSPLRWPDVEGGFGKTEEEVGLALEDVEGMGSSDEALELGLRDMLSPVKEVGLPHGLSNDEELLLAGDRGGTVCVGDDEMQWYWVSGRGCTCDGSRDLLRAYPPYGGGWFS